MKTKTTTFEPDEVYGVMSDFSNSPVSVEEMHEGIRKKIREEWERWYSGTTG